MGDHGNQIAALANPPHPKRLGKEVPPQATSLVCQMLVCQMLVCQMLVCQTHGCTDGAAIWCARYARHVTQNLARTLDGALAVCHKNYCAMLHERFYAMRRERSYYMLCQRNETGVYLPEFGDYDKECVMFERQCYRDQGARAKDMRIVRCRSARMSDVNAACAALS